MTDILLLHEISWSFYSAVLCACATRSDPLLRVEGDVPVWTALFLLLCASAFGWMRVSEWLRVGLHACVSCACLHIGMAAFSGHAALETSSVLQHHPYGQRIGPKEGSRTPNPLSRNMQKSLRADTPCRLLGADAAVCHAVCLERGDWNPVDDQEC